MIGYDSTVSDFKEIITVLARERSEIVLDRKSRIKKQKLLHDPTSNSNPPFSSDIVTLLEHFGFRKHVIAYILSNLKRSEHMDETDKGDHMPTKPGNTSNRYTNDPIHCLSSITADAYPELYNKRFTNDTDSSNGNDRVIEYIPSIVDGKLQWINDVKDDDSSGGSYSSCHTEFRRVPTGIQDILMRNNISELYDDAQLAESVIGSHIEGIVASVIYMMYDYLRPYVAALSSDADTSSCDTQISWEEVLMVIQQHTHILLIKNFMSVSVHATLPAVTLPLPCVRRIEARLFSIFGGIDVKLLQTMTSNV